jgi:energy-coupling factor transporter ATP-binding protein EcfA2
MADSGKGFIISEAASADDRTPQRERIIDAVQARGVTFWRDLDGMAFATVPIDPQDIENGPIAHYRVRARRFNLVCRQTYGAANPVTNIHGKRLGSVSDSAMQEAIPAFEAMALGMPACQPGVRLARNLGAIWIDLGDDTHRAIRVTTEGWTIETRLNAPLIRPDGMRALPTPVLEHGALDHLRSLLNVNTADFKLYAAWLVAALWPEGPYPVLALDGEQGSGKSTICRMLRRLVDPNTADLRAVPRNEDDLLIAAMNGRIVAFDNVSYIESDMADALCRVATGAGFGKRTMYSDLGETIISVCRPVLLNGIPSLLARGDLADRSIAITRPHIPDDKRRTEEVVWQEFDKAAPGILALLLDALVTALRRLPELKLEHLPRMADFARLACAAAPAFGWTEADMLTAIENNREAAVETVVEADQVAEAVRTILAELLNGWEGTATMLLEAINLRVSEDVKKERGWPKDAARLSARLKRVQPALRRVGIEIEHTREGNARARTITLRQSRKTASAASAASACYEKPYKMDVFCADAEKTAASASVRSASANLAASASKMPANHRFFANADVAADAADGADAVFSYLEGVEVDGDDFTDEVVI